MKNIFNPRMAWRVLSVLVSVILSSQVSAEGHAELGLSYSNIEYIEPNVMREEGYLVGFQARFTNYDAALVALELDYAYGRMDYQGSGTMENIPDMLFEMRALAGPRLYKTESSSLHTYVGFAQRYLSDDSSGKRSSTGALGYTREQYYWYIPVGLNWRYALQNGWKVALRAEHDFFLRGLNYSGLGAVCGGDNGEFTQDEGEGYRFAVNVMVPYKNGRNHVSIEPYYRYWDIADSDTQLLDTPNCTGSGSAYYYEPENTSEEIGIAVRWVF